MILSDLRTVFRKYKIDSFVYPMFYCLPFALRFEGTEILRRVFHDAFPGAFLLVTEGETHRFRTAETERETQERIDLDSGEFTVYERQVTPFSAGHLPERFFEDVKKETVPVFCVDPETGMMLTVYGGEGFDICAPRPEPLAPLYKKFKAYLSLIDLPEMKLKFEE